MQLEADSPPSANVRPRSLTARAWRAFAAAAGALLLVQWAVGHWVIESQVRSVEHAQLDHTLTQVATLLQRDLRTIGNTAYEYGGWDAAFEFVRGQKPEFVDTDVGIALHHTVGVDVHAYLDANGHLIWHRQIDLESGEAREPSPALLATLTAAARQAPSEPLVPWVRLWRIQHRLALIAVTDVVRTDGSGPRAGQVVFARWLSPSVLADYGRLLGGPIDVVLEEPARSGMLALPETAQRRGERIELPLAADVRLAIQRPAALTHYLERTLWQLLLAQALGWAVVFALLLYRLQRELLMPLSTLHAQVERLDRGRAERLSIEGAPEVRDLANALNESLEQREQRDRRLLERDAGTAIGRLQHRVLATFQAELVGPAEQLRQLLDRCRTGGRSAAMEGELDAQARAVSEDLRALLDWARLEAGLLELHPLPVQSTRLIREALEAMEPLASAKELSLTLDLPPGPGSVIEIDPARTQQICTLLLREAIRRTAVGRVSLEARLRFADPERTELEVSIRDSGPGLAPDRIEQLFTPLGTVGAEDGLEPPRRSVHLALVKGLVDRMGGTISVHGSIEHGNSFQVRIPVRLVQGGKPAEPEPHPAARRCGRVLLVEDDPMTQELIRLVFEELEWEVTTAGDGARGIERARQQRFDLIVFDRHLPNVDGIEATAILRTDPSHANHATPIFGISAELSAAEGRRWLAAGVQTILAKPLRMSDLRQALERCGHLGI